MKKYTLSILILSTFLTACGGNTTKPAQQSASAMQTSENSDRLTLVYVPQSVEVSSNKGQISRAAMNECTLTTQYSQLLKAYAADQGIQVQMVHSQKPTDKGYFLKPKFTQIFSAGNPFIGHNKYTQMHMILYKDGQKISEADFGRRSGGGFFGGYKSSCSVLGRTVEANAEDTIMWLNSPVNGAQFGDLN